MRSPRFTVRWLMVAVAVACLLAYGARLVSLSRRYDSAAGRFKGLAWIEDYPTASRLGMTGSPDRLRSARDDWNRRYRSFQHFRAMQAKYDRAARYPWLPVEPDPPVPD